MSGCDRVSFIMRFVYYLYSVLFCALSLFLSFDLYSQAPGIKHFKHYSSNDYQHHVQNWAIAQAKNGILYVANQAGLLEYDGVSWRVIQTPGYDTVHSLAIDDETETIYVGGEGRIGMLRLQPDGSWGYESLLKYLGENAANFSTVWDTHYLKNAVYFRASKFLFRWSSGKMDVYEPAAGNSFKASFVLNGVLLVQEGGRGLLRMENSGLKPMPGGGAFGGKKLRVLVPYDERQTLLTGSRGEEFRLYNTASGDVTSFPTAEYDYVTKHQLAHSVRLKGGNFAVATRSGGVVVIGQDGKLKHKLGDSYGLQAHVISSIFQDGLGNLWLALENGILKIAYASPVSMFAEQSGLRGIVHAVLRHSEDIYAGASTGLYYLESTGGFSRIEGMRGNCVSLAAVGDSILAATTTGVYQVKNKIPGLITQTDSKSLLVSRNYPGRVWCGDKDGFVVLSSTDGRWEIKQRIEGVNKEIRTIAEDNSGNVWLGTPGGTAYKLSFSANDDQPGVIAYDKSHKLPDEEIRVVWAAGHVMFMTDNGLFRFDEKQEIFVTDNTLGDKFANAKYPIFRLAQDGNNNIWFHSRSKNYLAVPEVGNALKYTHYLRPWLPTIQVNVVYPEPDGKTIWYAAVNGLFRFDTTFEKIYTSNYKTFVRKVVINNRLIFSGGEFSAIGSPAKFVVEHSQRKNLHFEFAAPYFEAEAQTEYRTQLNGLDDNWSEWSKKQQRDFTILDSGTYTFQVEAKNVYGDVGATDEFQFRILPPWYMTWWALLLYMAGFILVMFSLVKWRSIRLEKEKRYLEQVVKERTKEIGEKNVQLEEKTHQLEEQSEQLKEMDRIKSRFFANISHEFRTPLTLIMSPLEQMLEGRGDKKNKKDLQMMMRSSQRLLGLINQLLDLSRFDSGKMKLQASCQNIVPFIKGILASFEMAAPRKGLNLEFLPGEPDIPVYFDAPKMEQALQNLLINSVKFTPGGGTITVAVNIETRDRPGDGSGSAGVAKISVKDTGIGISQDQMLHIFERFFQVESPHEKGLKGTGIGLAITKETVNLHHGTISVHSQEGKGTTFVIQLPLGCDHLSEDEIAAAPAPPHVTRDEKDEYIDDGNLFPEGGPLPDTPKDENSGSKTGGKDEEEEETVVLVVEDNEEMRGFICRSLEPYYSVESACDGKEGIDKAKEIIPDLIVSDVMMPEINGYELCRRLKQDLDTSHVPIILLTAKASAESKLQGLGTGADDYVTKPFNTTMLLSRIKNLIDLRKQLQLTIQRQKMQMPARISVSSMDEKFLVNFQEIIEKNLADEDFNIDTLCEKIGMPRATLFKKIKALTGETPNQFIQTYRLERAVQLLREGYGNITDVALAAGFGSSAYFSKCFKDKYGVSPSSYRTSGAPSG